MPAAAALVLQLLAGWSSLQWFVQRTTGAGDEPWGLVALLALVTLGDCSLRRAIPPSHLLALGVWNLVAAALHPWLPPMLDAAFLVVALTVISSGHAPGLPALTLGMLSLPVVPSLQFYLDHPLRLFSAVLASPLLSLAGQHVSRDGSLLTVDGHAVSVDAACSGVRMLWAGLFLCSCLGLVLRWRWLAAVWMTVAAVCLVVVANAMRVACLAMLGELACSLPWLHGLVGVGAFVLLAASLVVVGRQLPGEEAAA